MVSAKNIKSTETPRSVSNASIFSDRSASSSPVSSATSPGSERITEEGYLAPSKSITIKVEKPKNLADVGLPRFATMSDSQIKDLYLGPLVHISIQQKTGKAIKLNIPKVSINLLCAHSRVVEAAVAKSGLERQDIGEIVLPAGSDEAYEALIKWMDELTVYPRKKEFPVHRHTPAFVYWHCIEIAEFLGLKSIVEPLSFRLNLFSLYEPKKEDGKGFLIVPEDVERVYRELGKDHSLTKTLVKNVALAWNDNAIFSRKYATFTEMTYNIPEFWDDLGPLLDEDKKGGSRAVNYYKN